MTVPLQIRQSTSGQYQTNQVNCRHCKSNMPAHVLDTQTVRTSQSAPEFIAPILQRIGFHALVRIHSLKLRVLRLQLLDLLKLRCSKTTISILPLVVCQRTNAMLPTDHLYRYPCLGFLQNRNNLGLGES